MKLAIILFIIYLPLNIFITFRLNKANYINEEMRKLHKKLIWILPFIGPLVLKNFWKNEKTNKLHANTKAQRDQNLSSGSFYESGKGMDF
jgi:hypothetical protein